LFSRKAMAHFLLLNKPGTRKHHNHLRFMKTPEVRMNLFSKLREMRILLIDDDEWIRDSLSLFFENEGCHLLALETAEEGLEEINRKSYDIIITDYKLPGMDGLEFLERINRSHPDVLTMMITAYGSKDVFLKARKTRVQEFIDKPFTIEAIEDSLSRLIQNHEQREI
jgi:DNA-binding NtrC family response regulator